VSFLSTARAAIIAKAAGITGMLYTYSRMPDTIGGTPAMVLGQMTAVILPGNREVTTYNWELFLYQERLGDDDRTVAAVDDMIELVQTAYAQGITLGQGGETRQCVLRSFTANDWFAIGETEYLRPRFILELTATRTRPYTA
jgi:hypothetical protein